MMKKFAVILCLLAVIVAVAAVISGKLENSCGNKETQTYPVSDTQESETLPLTVKVVFPEGFNADEMAARLEENNVCSAQEFIDEVNNPENLSLLDFELAETENRAFLLEGFLFPDTYEFYTNTSAHSVVVKMVDNFNSKFTSQYAARADELGYTPDEIVSLASIIQEEAGNPVEMPRVSAVIHNRLDSSSYSYIQCDVAVKYLMNTVKRYYDDTRYHEICDYYNIVSDRKGLPAGAITNPGTAAIEAALYPDKTEYYYFVTDSDGNYYYAETYEEHCVNCRKAGIKGY